MTSRIVCILSAAAIMLAPLAVTPLAFADDDISLLPLYGGRTKSESEIRSDDQFRRDAVASAGSADKAASILVAKGFDSISKKDTDTAVRRFNQAWLLKPDKADVYWGLASVESLRGEDEQSLKLFEQARKIDPQNAELLTDYAYAHMRYAAHTSKDQADAKQHLLTSAQLLHDAKVRNPKYELAYTNSALLFAQLNRPQEAWEQVFAAESLGGKTLPRFLADLEHDLPRRAAAAQQRASLAAPQPKSGGSVRITSHGDSGR